MSKIYKNLKFKIEKLVVIIKIEIILVFFRLQVGYLNDHCKVLIVQKNGSNLCTRTVVGSFN